mgnify:CR=1 FL=1
MAFKMKGFSPFDKNGNPEATANANMGANIASGKIFTKKVNGKNVTYVKFEDGSEGPASQYTRDIKDPKTGKVETLSLLEMHKRGMKL